MGIISSSTSSTGNYNQIKDQISRLGERNPFGDDEILRLSRCMSYLNAIATNYAGTEQRSKRFLTDWAVFCSTLPAANFSTDGTCYNDLLSIDPRFFEENSPDDAPVQQQRAKIRYIMDIIEKNVLPVNFGNILFEKSFALLSPPPDAHANTNETAQRNMDWKKLEKFMDGASEASRRGSRKALTCIFKCCSKRIGGADRANAKELLDLAYRLSLACCIYERYMENQTMMEEQKERLIQKEQRMLQKQKERNMKLNNMQVNPKIPGVDDNDEEQEEEDEEEETPIEPFDPSTLFPQDIGDTLSSSLLKYALKENSASPSVYGVSPPSFAYNDTSGQLHSKDGYQNDPDTVTLSTFQTWAESTAPCLSSTMETFIHLLFFPDKPYPPSRSQFIYPDLRGQHSAFFATGSSPRLFTFSSFSPSLGGAWRRLYTSDSDGLSFNRLQNSLLGYGGPTLLVVKEAESGGIFGASTCTAWKVSKDFYGNSDCFLFSIDPVVRVMRPRGQGGNYMYCNPESRSRGYDGLAHGIGFGGNADKPRLFLSESFDSCMAGSADLTFEPGSLLPPKKDGNPTKYFDLEALEVWGVGGDAVVEEALGARHKQREILASNIRKARKVDKAAFLDDFRSGLIESKAFKHRGEIRGRNGDCQDDK